MSDPVHKLTRQQERAIARTAEYVARNPGSLVVRTVVGTAFTRGKGGLIQGLGMFFAQPRRGHLIADESGLRMMQALDEAEWERTWREITLIEETGYAPRTLQLDATGFHAPKAYVLCKPDGDPLPVYEASGVISRLKRLAGRG